MGRRNTRGRPDGDEDEEAKTKAKARSTTASPFAQQAQAEAFLRTNPERSTLAQQLADARGDRDTSVSAANTAANANVAAARGAPAAYQRTYDDALSHVAAAISVPGADNPATGAGRDAAQTRGRLAEMLASAQTDAKQRELSAREGGQYAVGQANAGYDRRRTRCRRGCGRWRRSRACTRRSARGS
jgi:hypothetical protein